VGGEARDMGRGEEENGERRRGGKENRERRRG
jgi:hypothetical protein